MARGDVDAALNDYETNVTRTQDQLLRLMDEGLLLRSAERFEESNERFLKAAKIIEANGYLSLGEQGVTLLTNERQTTYQGEDFEKLLVHVYLSLNFLSLQEIESALVEARKVNQILFKMISQGAKPYEYNIFSKYLAGVLFEEERNFNDANVSYREVLKQDLSLVSRFSALGVDLGRMMAALGLGEDREWLEKQVGSELIRKGETYWRERRGSLVFILEAGKSPEKFSSRETHKIKGRDGVLTDVLLPVPYYRKRPARIRKAHLQIVGGSENGVTVQTALLHSVEETAIAHLKDRMGRAISKALLTASVKTGIAVGVGKATKSDELGLLAGLLLFAASEADTRSWLLLPGSFQVARLYLPPGDYELQIDFLNGSGEVISSELVKQNIKARRTSFLQRRVFE